MNVYVPSLLIVVFLACTGTEESFKVTVPATSESAIAAPDSAGSDTGVEVAVPAPCEPPPPLQPLNARPRTTAHNAKIVVMFFFMILSPPVK
jgi:hypothetical protein